MSETTHNPDEIEVETTRYGSDKAMRYKHPAMAVVGLSRVQSNGTNLFGSNVEHDHFIALHIGHATTNRHLSKDWYHKEDEIIEVYLTPVQFSELISTMNVGDGVPATISRLNGNNYELPTMPSKQQLFKQEIKDDVKTVMSSIKDTVNKMESYLNQQKPLTKAEKAELLNGIKAIDRFTADHLPFILTQFEEHMEKVVVEAKTTVDAFVQHQIVERGLESLGITKPKLIESENTTDKK